MKVGVLGCMAERLKKQILEKEKIVDVVCGPDAVPLPLSSFLDQFFNPFSFEPFP